MPEIMPEIVPDPPLHSDTFLLKNIEIFLPKSKNDLGTMQGWIGSTTLGTMSGTKRAL